MTSIRGVLVDEEHQKLNMNADHTLAENSVRTSDGHPLMYAQDYDLESDTFEKHVHGHHALSVI